MMLGLDFTVILKKALCMFGATLVCDLMRSQFSTLYHRTQYQVMTLVKGDELPCE